MKSISLRCNKFIITYYDYKLFVYCNIKIETNILGAFSIRNEKLKSLELIFDLNKIRLGNKEISEYLNNKNLKTFRTNNI